MTRKYQMLVSGYRGMTCASCPAVLSTWWHAHREPKPSYRLTAIYCADCLRARRCPCYVAAQAEVAQPEQAELFPADVQPPLFGEGA